MILREVRFRATCRCVQRCTPRRSPPIWFEHDAELTVATLALSRRRVLLVKRASVPPRQGINGLCPCPQNQNDYEIGYTRPMLTTLSRAMADRGRMWKYAVKVQTILRFPDHHLRATAQRVVVFDEDLCSLATDLLDTLRAASAIGITATHIGALKRLAMIELAAADGVRTYVNPQIVWASADMIRHEEGSVSMPGVTEEIERHARVRMRYQDLSGVESIEGPTVCSPYVSRMRSISSMGSFGSIGSPG